ncbi:DUF262 domain-containing protein [Flavobacterium gilvum]|uniref:DUF262 domain-containing protein n=1 Tax=Flavobacterium gilvum TaxID=1492737 RepID=A0AAC9I720_9FLAO|nr:DUF262 domain-containing protein [Flavobacterium gilvum]AOW10476.1 hypothetical protein EM308_13740 [Flavobacterium gilvum]KFC61144.1 hypothetical protein FEM08_00800 [Flavobacterium gilvum]
MSNSIELKSIGTIINERTFFFVDSYQRGYKWDKQQVEDLLNDINEFEPGKNGDFYCLQPVVVKEKDKVELIDGQQRMTTIFIILSFLKKEKYNIDYQTRNDSAWFLSSIVAKNEIRTDSWDDFKKIDFENERTVNNIDNYHFFNAYHIIKKWFSSKIDTDKFYNKLVNDTKIIWYQVNENVKSQEIFGRINIGKIPLTNSELIKALFLSSNKNEETIKNQIEVKWDSGSSAVSISGFDKINKLNNDLKNEIALEWDFIEKELQNDEFWYFISDERENRFTRIDLLLDIVSNRDFENKKQDSLYSFHYFTKKSDLKQEWSRIAELFYTLQDWYHDLELYHLVGYLISVSGKNKLKDLCNEQKEKSKTTFKEWLKNTIQESETIAKFGEYGYGSGLVTNALLLFNIKTHIKTSSENNFNRFPFKSYKINKWSIEHIHAQNSEGLISKEQWITWLNDAVLGMKKFEANGTIENLILKINETINSRDDLKREEFQKLFDEVIKNTSEDHENEIHDIGNLALLDGSTNSSISNGIFASKRQMILDAEKNKTFIPVCTKNVFLKYYTKDPKQFYFWSKNDRENYLEAIKKILDIKESQIKA